LLRAFRKSAHFGDHLSNGPDVRQVVEGNGNVEPVLQLADEFQYLQGIESKIRQQLALGHGLHGPAAQLFDELDDVVFEAVGRSARIRRGSRVLRI
jgi:hypothetical protein